MASLGTYLCYTNCHFIVNLQIVVLFFDEIVQGKYVPT